MSELNAGLALYSDHHCNTVSLRRNNRLTSLIFRRTYPAQASLGPPSCTKPREPTILSCLI